MLPGRHKGDVSALGAAHAAMAAGCLFLIARGACEAPALNASRVCSLLRLRVAGNGLKELDRFLSILIDEYGKVGGMKPEAKAASAPGCDTPRKLRRIAAPGMCFASDMPRLRAIERVRTAACGDRSIAFGARLECDLAIASAGAARRRAPGATPDIGDRALAAIAEFYLSIADRLANRWHALCRARGVSLTFPQMECIGGKLTSPATEIDAE